MHAALGRDLRTVTLTAHGLALESHVGILRVTEPHRAAVATVTDTTHEHWHFLYGLRKICPSHVVDGGHGTEPPGRVRPVNEVLDDGAEVIIIRVTLPGHRHGELLILNGPFRLGAAAVTAE
jgi:hypothetical protein